MPCGMWDIISPSRGGTQPLGTDVQSLNHQTTRELPLWYSFLSTCTWCRLSMIYTAFQHLLRPRQETTASGAGEGEVSGCLSAKLSSQLGSQSSRSFADAPRRAGPLVESQLLLI